MNTIKLTLRATQALDPVTREQVLGVFARAFRVETEAEACLAPYFHKVKGILLAHQGDCLLGFQFYQELTVDGQPVHHFSLAARLPEPAARGLQRRFGRFLIGRCLFRRRPWAPVWLAGVTNSPRSYFNMHDLGGRIFPDVLDPAPANPFGDFYQRVAQALALPEPDSRGLLRDRMQGLGFGLVADRDTNPEGRAYALHVQDNLDHGVFVLLRIVPALDLPAYLLGRLKAVRRPRLVEAKP